MAPSRQPVVLQRLVDQQRPLQDWVLIHCQWPRGPLLDQLLGPVLRRWMSHLLLVIQPQDC